MAQVVRNEECIIWGTPANYIGETGGRDGSTFDSPRAGGTYRISRQASFSVPRLSERQKAILSYEIVRSKCLGEIFEINMRALEDLDKIGLPNITDRIEGLLTFLISKSEHIGQKLDFRQNTEISIIQNSVLKDKPWWHDKIAPLFAFSCSTELAEITFLLDILLQQNFISMLIPGNISDILVLPAGYAKNEKLKRNTRNKQAFVAMWFNQEMETAYNSGILPAILDNGYDPVRIDKKEHINKIDDEIVAEIRRSRFLIADFTSEAGKPRGGVYFEAGFALGLDIPVIWTCRSDLISDVHFDTRQFNHIVWKNETDLHQRLSNRIAAVITL
jgi:nucleoside 2-deoxyribosyltransferase